MSVLLLFGWLHACTGEQSVRHVSERRAKVRECPRVDDKGCPSLRVLSVNTPVILIGAGAGITPLLSMFHCIGRHSSRRTVFFVGGLLARCGPLCRLRLGA